MGKKSQEELSAAQDALKDIDGAAEGLDAKDGPEAGGQEKEKKDEDGKETDGVVAEPDSNTKEGHDQRSQMGRKLAAYGLEVDSIKGDIVGIKDQLTQLIQVLGNNQGQISSQQEAEFMDTSDPNVFRSAVRSEISNVLTENQKAENQYVDAAKKSLWIIDCEYNDKEFAVIARDAMDNWERDTNDPHLDAKMNFARAENRYLKLMQKGKTNPFSKNGTEDIKGLGGETQTKKTVRQASEQSVSKNALAFKEYLKTRKSKVV